MEFRGARLECLPAGHILGAAQLRIELGGECLVYTGDIKLREPLCGVTSQMPRCDRLIMECTFGLPVFHFLDRLEARERMVAFAHDCLVRGETPAFLGYPLGRGQEAAHVLCTAGIPTAIHGAIARYLPWYESAGYEFPGWVPYERRNREPRALVVVPGMRNVLEAMDRNVRIALVSGWAAFSAARTRSGAEELIPYSDHGDFEELIALARGSGARHIDLVHGYTEPFAQILRSLGIEAASHAETTTQATNAEEAEG